MQTYIIQTLMAFGGSIGYALFFNVKKDRLLWLGLDGALIWAIFLFVQYMTGREMVGLFAASLLGSLFAEILARIFKCPVTVLLMPSLIALIPGGNLYYTMSYLVQGDSLRFQATLSLVLKEAASIAVGILVAASLMQIIRKTGIYRHKRQMV